MNNNVDPKFHIGHDPDLQQSAALISPDEHVKFLEHVHVNGIAIGVEHLVVGHAVLASRMSDDRIHSAIISIDIHFR